GVAEGNLAIALAELGRNQEGLAHIDRAIAILENGLGAGHRDRATQLSTGGEVFNALGRYRDARQSFEKARIVWERELGVDDRNLAYALTGIGIGYLSDGRPHHAIATRE